MSLTTLMIKMMTKKGAKVKEELIQATCNPRKTQEELLFSLIEKAKDTEFGKKMELSSITSVEEFQKKIPICDYDDYCPYIDKMILGEKNVLTSEKIIHFNTTSGTLGAPKNIPVTNSHVKVFSRLNASYLNYLISETVGNEWMKYKGFSLAEGTYKVLPTGVSIGCASSLMAARIGKMIPFLKIDMCASLYTSPVEARQPEQGTTTRYLHARFALMEKDVSYINATFSSYLLEIMRYMEDNSEELINDIRYGTINENVEMPDNVRKSLMRKIKPMPDRADELEKIFSEGFSTECPIMKKLWPRLSYVICVGGAGFLHYTEKLKERYCGNDIPFLFLGVSASEGYFSAPVDINNTSSVLVPNGVFLEFIPIDDQSATPLLMDQLEEGKEYEIIVSNLGGLFRYRMKDVVRVTGFYNKTPMVEFVSRKGSAINMFGEKTTEKALQMTAVKTAEKLGLDLYDYAFYPDSESALGHYVMLMELRNGKNLPSVDEMAKIAEDVLIKANEDLGEVLHDGTCGHLEVKLLQKETFLLYKDLQVYKGRSAAQLKPIHVLTEVTKKFFYGLLEE